MGFRTQDLWVQITASTLNDVSVQARHYFSLKEGLLAKMEA